MFGQLNSPLLLNQLFFFFFLLLDYFLLRKYWWKKIFDTENKREREICMLLFHLEIDLFFLPIISLIASYKKKNQTFSVEKNLL